MRPILAALFLLTLTACAHADAPDSGKAEAAEQADSDWWCNFMGNCKKEKDVQCGFYGKCPGKGTDIYGNKAGTDIYGNPM